MTTTKEHLIEALTKRFPKAWFKDGADFRNDGSNSVWSGEGSYLNDGTPMFDYYGPYSTYEFGVHKQVRAFVEKKGWYWECNDAGTYFAYPQ